MGDWDNVIPKCLEENKNLRLVIPMKLATSKKIENYLVWFLCFVSFYPHYSAMDDYYWNIISNIYRYFYVAQLKYSFFSGSLNHFSD